MKKHGAGNSTKPHHPAANALKDFDRVPLAAALSRQCLLTAHEVRRALASEDARQWHTKTNAPALAIIHQHTISVNP